MLLLSYLTIKLNSEKLKCNIIKLIGTYLKLILVFIKHEYVLIYTQIKSCRFT